MHGIACLYHIGLCLIAGRNTAFEPVSAVYQNAKEHVAIPGHQHLPLHLIEVIQRYSFSTVWIKPFFSRRSGLAFYDDMLTVNVSLSVKTGFEIGIFVISIQLRSL